MTREKSLLANPDSEIVRNVKNSDEVYHRLPQCLSRVWERSAEKSSNDISGKEDNGQQEQYVQHMRTRISVQKRKRIARAKSSLDDPFLPWKGMQKGFSRCSWSCTTLGKAHSARTPQVSSDKTTPAYIEAKEPASSDPSSFSAGHESPLARVI